MISYASEGLVGSAMEPCSTDPSCLPSQWVTFNPLEIGFPTTLAEQVEKGINSFFVGVLLLTLFFHCVDQSVSSEAV